MLRAWNRGEKRIAVLRGLVEVAGIMFLFYANLLMGEFNRSSGRGKTMAAALRNIVTRENLAIAVVSAILGYLVFHSLRQLLRVEGEPDDL